MEASISLDPRPDWVKEWTAEEAEQELTNFKFKGPGWYHADGDTLLVAPTEDFQYTGSYRDPVEKDPWRARWPKETKFRFFVWAQRNPGAAFNAITNAPERT